MARQHNGHLTTEQLSAFLDKQLSARERLDWNAHLSTCQLCQGRLADLQQTVALLHALPQAELPRSFVLPASTTLAPERPVRQFAIGTPIPRADRRRHPIFQRSVRVLSTIAAVVGFILIMSGFLANVNIGFGGAASAPTSGYNGTHVTASSRASTPPGSTQSNLPGGANQPTKGLDGSATSTPQETPTPPDSVSSAQPPGNVQNQNSSLPAPLDLSRPEGHEGVGFILLVLGILGLIVTGIIRRRTARVSRDMRT